MAPEVMRMANREQAAPQYPSGEEVSERVDEALKQFLKNDRDLIHVDANERSITHKLGEHLQKVFPGWDVDCEYNRDGEQPKRLRSELEAKGAKHEGLEPDDTEAKTVYPDIIVHRRCTSHNLLVIEAKKRCHLDSTSIDEHKLKRFTSRCGQFGYRYGLLLIFGDTVDEVPRQRWLSDGEERCTACIGRME